MRNYLEPILRWWWLIALSTIAAAASSYFSVSQQPPVYEAHASVIVGRSINDPNPSASEFSLEQQLAAAYANVGSRKIANPTMKALQLEKLPSYTVRPVPNSPLIEIVVTDTNPQRVQAVANELARQLVKSSPSGENTQETARQQFVNDQLDKLQAQIKDTEQQIIDSRQKLAEVNSARQIDDLQTLIDALETKQISLQGTFTSLLANSQQGAINNVAVLEWSGLPVQPVGPNKPLYILIAAAIGFALAVAATYAIELLDSRVKTGEEIATLLDAPILGYIPNLARVKNRAVFTSHYPRSPITDAFRSLRTNLEFLGVERPLRTILVSGPQGADGKSTVAANLALTIAQSEKKVILLEADLRRPSLHSDLEVDGEPGLSDLCVGRANLQSTLVPWEQIAPIRSGQEDAEAENTLNTGPAFSFLPAGTLPPNPAELLASARFDQILTELAALADVVIIDCPPLYLPDAAVLLTHVDGVLLVVQPRKVYKKDVERIKEQVHRSGVRLLGIVLNRSGSVRTYEKYEINQSQPPNQSPKLRLPEIHLP